MLEKLVNELDLTFKNGLRVMFRERGIKGEHNFELVIEQTLDGKRQYGIVRELFGNERRYYTFGNIIYFNTPRELVVALKKIMDYKG